ncbi:hypothetical protein U5922_001045 (plasmid) [Aquicoccus sp. G2-2]|uniref:hypothetical protein n=1 Tax=Aquicoccus sp. G2-2 TaxID=3092120 RepID=UPI002AE0A6E4|nr:hypothetical protein [Aquicoccus sp. G2-2]MEA1112114.1 hypothetical protein [Aquicoccus sp. G2-2]
MTKALARLAAFFAAALLILFGATQHSEAQTYQIDCAILLCLSGGWPTSAPCSRARSEFIRRITPWPVEPPLQIWRCPMGASYEAENQLHGTVRFLDILFNGRKEQSRQSLSRAESVYDTGTVNPLWQAGEFADRAAPVGIALRHIQDIQDRADIDISGPEFNFVRSIRVFDIRYARQYFAGSEGGCERAASIRLGTYGTQGDFSWKSSSPAALPEAHVGLKRWGLNCPNIYHRSVFVEWRDYGGNYGFEQVNY